MILLFEKRIDDTRFVPKRVLNYGSGIGSVFWACHQKWRDRVDEYLLVDPSNEMNKLCMDILRVSVDYRFVLQWLKAGNETGPFVHRNVSFRQSLPALSDNSYDLVVAAFTLIECDSQQSRERLLETLWRRAEKWATIIVDIYDVCVCLDI